MAKVNEHKRRKLISGILKCCCWILTDSPGNRNFAIPERNRTSENGQIVQFATSTQSNHYAAAECVHMNARKSIIVIDFAESINQVYFNRLISCKCFFTDTACVFLSLSFCTLNHCFVLFICFLLASRFTSSIFHNVSWIQIDSSRVCICIMHANMCTHSIYARRNCLERTRCWRKMKWYAHNNAYGIDLIDECPNVRCANDLNMCVWVWASCVQHEERKAN